MKKFLVGLFLIFTVVASAQVVDTGRLTPNFSYGINLKALQVGNNLIIPRFGDTVSKEPGQVKIIGSKFYFSGKDLHWHETSSSGGTVYEAGYGVKLVTNVFLADTFRVATKENRDKLKDTLLAVIGSLATPTLAQVLAAGNAAPASDISELNSIAVNDINSSNINSYTMTCNSDLNTVNVNASGYVSANHADVVDVNASGTVTGSYLVGDGSGIYNLPAGTESDPVYSAAAGGLLHKTDSTIYSTKANYKKGMDSLGAIIGAAAVDTLTISTKKYRQKGIDSVAALIPSLGGYVNKSDSTLYSTKANYKKGMDSLGAIMSAASVDTLTISTRKWRQKGIDSVAGLIPVVTGYLAKTDSTIYSTKANYKKGMDSLGALIGAAAVDTLTISTRKWRQKGIDSVAALIPSLSGYVQKTDSTLYSTKANYKKGADSLGALIATNTANISTNTSNILLKKNIADSLHTTADNYVRQDRLKNFVDSSIGAISGGSVYTASAPIVKTGSTISADTSTTTTGLSTKGNALNLANGKANIATPTFTTNITTPVIIGGTGTTSTLTYQTTSGVGATGADHIWKVGNNGATEAMRILNAGNVLIGATSLVGTEQLSVQNNQNAATRITVSNTTAGTASQAALFLQTSGSTGLDINAYSASFTTSGGAVAGSSRIQASGANGLHLGTSTTAPIILKIGAIEKWRVDVNGAYTNALATGGTTAVLDIQSTTKGVLMPRMSTSQRDAISSPAEGLIIYDTTVHKLSIYNGTVWKYVQFE